MVNSNKVGLVVAAVIAGWHVCWALLVAVHWAQPFLDFIFWAHMIRPVYTVKPFDPAAAGTLIIITAALGYILGYFGAVVWNRLHRS